MSTTRRAPRGYTFDPCHGCGKVPEDYGGRPTAGVCESCKAALDIQAQLASEVRPGDRQVFIMNERAYAQPYMHRVPTEIRDVLQQAFWKLAMLLSKVTTEQAPRVRSTEKYARPDDMVTPESAYLWPNLGGSARRGEWRIDREFEIEQALALKAVYQATADAALAAYASGHEDGRSLMLQLAGGQITSDEFNDAAARAAGEKG